ncbi:MAG: 4-oxalocrotonate tautomerase family protein [Xanthobacteraceae bacterium]
MPHVIVKLYAGRSDRQKQRLAEEITRAVVSTLKSDEESISVAIEDVKPEDWVRTVYEPDILGKRKTIYKQPGYDPLGQE